MGSLCSLSEETVAVLFWSRAFHKFSLSISQCHPRAEFFTWPSLCYGAILEPSVSQGHALTYSLLMFLCTRLVIDTNPVTHYIMYISYICAANQDKYENLSYKHSRYPSLQICNVCILLMYLNFILSNKSQCHALDSEQASCPSFQN